MVAEKGRSDNTLSAYRRDLTALRPLARGARAHARRRADGRARRLRRRAAGERCGHLVDRPPARRDPDAPSLPRARGGARRRPGGRTGGCPRPVGNPQAADRGPGDEPARRRHRDRADPPTRPGAAGAALRHRRPDLRSGRALGRRDRPRRPARASLRQGCQGAHRAVRHRRRPRRSRTGSRRRGGRDSSPRSGGAATMPRPCSSTPAAAG